MKKLREEEIVTNIDDKITEIISFLADNTFGNSESRKHFSVCMHQLAISKDPRARKLIRQLGNSLTQLGQDLLTTPVENHELGNNFKMIDEDKIEKYKSLFKGE